MDEIIERLRNAANTGGIEDLRKYIRTAERIDHPVNSTDLATYVEHLKPTERFNIRQLDNMEDWVITSNRPHGFDANLGQWLLLKFNQLACYGRPFEDIVYDMIRYSMFQNNANITIVFIGYILPNRNINFSSPGPGVASERIQRLIKNHPHFKTFKLSHPKLLIIYYKDSHYPPVPQLQEEWYLNIFSLVDGCEVSHESFTSWITFDHQWDLLQQRIIIRLFQAIPLFVGCHTMAQEINGVEEWIPDFLAQYAQLLAYFNPTDAQLEELGLSMDLSKDQVAYLFDRAEPERSVTQPWENYRWPPGIAGFNWNNNFIQFPRLVSELSAIDWTDEQINNHPIYNREALEQILDQSQEDFQFIKNLTYVHLRSNPNRLD